MPRELVELLGQWDECYPPAWLKDPDVLALCEHCKLFMCEHFNGFCPFTPDRFTPYTTTYVYRDSGSWWVYMHNEPVHLGTCRIAKRKIDVDMLYQCLYPKE